VELIVQPDAHDVVGEMGVGGYSTIEKSVADTRRTKKRSVDAALQRQ